MALLCGVLGVLGMQLALLALPTLSYWQRTCLIGAGWGLPLSCLMLGKDALTKEGIGVVSPIVLLVMSLGYGALMATTQTRKAKG